MLSGCVWGSWAARAASQASSVHANCDSTTMLAVAGGTSAALASGSAFCRHEPSGPRISYLYRAPAPTPGTKSSHTPLSPSERIGCVAPQPLKSPMTRTARALGAQTANAVPVVSPSALG